MMKSPLSNMMIGLESVKALREEAKTIKEWLRDHPAAAPEAIAEQRRRLKEVLEALAKTVK